MSSSRTMKAVVTSGTPGKATLRYDVPIPVPRPDQVLVKIVAAAQNPTQWMLLENMTTPGVVLGCDFAGVVEEIGADVPKEARKVGDRVAGFFLGGANNDLGGTFAEYCVADAQVLITIPESMSFEEAAGLGLCGFTGCQTLWQSQSLPRPDAPGDGTIPILVWGGATSVGQFVIQLATLSGLTVVTTASPKNAEYVRSLGAKAVYDYRDSDVAQKIKADYPNIKRGVDCISSPVSIKGAAASISDEGGKISLVLLAESPREDVKTELSMVYCLLGKGFDWEVYHAPPDAEQYRLGKEFAAVLSDLLRAGKLRSTPARVVPNGLADAQQWIEYQRDGKVSAEKITYRIADTV